MRGSRDPLWWGSVPREQAFHDPDRLLVDRASEGPHLAFGKGEHFCLGAPIARLETRVGITTWLRRTKESTLDIDPDDVEYLPSFAQHGIVRLPLRFTPA